MDFDEQQTVPATKHIQYTHREPYFIAQSRLFSTCEYDQLAERHSEHWPGNIQEYKPPEGFEELPRRKNPGWQVGRVFGLKTSYRINLILGHSADYRNSRDKKIILLTSLLSSPDQVLNAKLTKRIAPYNFEQEPISGKTISLNGQRVVQIEWKNKISLLYPVQFSLQGGPRWVIWELTFSESPDRYRKYRDAVLASFYAIKWKKPIQYKALPTSK